jgi:hypothetical protein
LGSEFISFAGPHVNQLTIKYNLGVDQLTVEALLNKLTNLERLELYSACVANEVNLNLKLTIIKYIKIRYPDRDGFEKLLNSLEKCAIETAELLNLDDMVSAETLQRFLEVHQIHLKKLVMSLGHANLLNAGTLMDLQLEHLELSFVDHAPSEFLHLGSGKSASLQENQLS